MVAGLVFSKRVGTVSSTVKAVATMLVTEGPMMNWPQLESMRIGPRGSTLP